MPGPRVVFVPINTKKLIFKGKQHMEIVAGKTKRGNDGVFQDEAKNTEEKNSEKQVSCQG